jgi:hypothetical protein
MTKGSEAKLELKERLSRSRTFPSALDMRAQGCVHATVVPNSLPTAAVTNIANIPQMVTLTAPTSMGAPPIRAATAPSATRHNNDTTETASTSAVAGATRIV